MAQPSVDFVITWVDDRDASWRALRDSYRSADDDREAVSDVRYRDWGLLRHWFRGVERFAPWVRRIHLVTENPVPPWLVDEHPRLRVVAHADFIPPRFLPTFNSRVIELNLHRIEDLAEQFVYFNDDMFVTRPIVPEHFFVGGLPRAFAILNALTIGDNVSHAMLNNAHVLNQAFDKHRVIRGALSRWFSARYGVRLLQNVALLPWSRFSSFHNAHLPMALLRRHGEAVWAAFPESLEETCRSRFRRLSDLNPYLLSWWAICAGEFVPASPRSYGRYEQLRDDAILRVARDISAGKHALTCLNDGDLTDPARAMGDIASAFEALLPAASTFEHVSEGSA